MRWNFQGKYTSKLKFNAIRKQFSFYKFRSCTLLCVDYFLLHISTLTLVGRPKFDFQRGQRFLSSDGRKLFTFRLAHTGFFFLLHQV